MWNESRVLSWPLMFKRQYAQPLDIDSVFETLAGMDAYLSNTLRHVGQIATCQETEGIIYIMNNNRDAWVTVDTGSGSLIFATTTDLNTYLTNDDRKAGSIATCLETEGILYILNNLRDTWITIDIYSKLDSTEFYTHTGDTSIHYTKDTINITDINSAHTHSISEVSDLQTDLNSKLNLTGGTLSGTLEALTIIANDYSGVTTSMVYNTSTLSGETIEEILEDSISTEATTILLDDLLVGGRIEDINGVNTQVNKYWSWELLKDDIITNIPSDLTALNAHTGDTSIHFTKDSINIADINSAHTHTITDVTDLQNELNSKTDLVLFNAHTGETNPHLTDFSDLIVTAHTHEISDTINLQTVLNSKLNLSGGELTGNLTAVTYYGDGSHLTGIVSGVDVAEYNSHTGDTSIHFTKNNINISDINSAHTHGISEVSNLQTSLNSKTDLTLFNIHTATTNAHDVSFSNLIITAHTHTITDIPELQTTLNNKTDLITFNSHTGDTSIHYIKSDINISDINSAHTHGILDVNDLQTNLNSKTDLSLFNSHTGDTNPHLTEFSDLITTAHTHTISDVINLETSLNSKLDLTGGELIGNLTAVTYYGDGSHLTGIVAGVDISEYNSHTGDTSIHYTKDSINISDINSAHTHGISDVSNLQTSLNSKTDLVLFLTHTGDTNPHLTEFSDLIITAHTHTIADTTNLQTTLNNKTDLSLFNSHTATTNAHAVSFSNLISTAHTHTIADTTNLQTTLNNKTDLSLFSTHTGQTNPHLTKFSDLIVTAHTHTIADTTNLQTSLNNKTDLSLFNSHTGQTNPHQTKFSDLIVTAHTHTIADVSNLQTSLNSKLSLTGGTMTGTLIGTTISATTYQGIKASHVVNDSINVTGSDLKTILDNATLAIDGVTIQDADLFPIAREVEAPAGVFKSVNMYHSWDRIKDEIKDTCGTYYINTFEEFKTIVEDPLTPSDNITFYLSNGNVFIMVGTITCHTENIYVKSQNTSVYLATLTINTTLIDTPNRIHFDGVCRIGDTEITITIPSETTTLFIKELVGDELYPSSLNILKSGAGYLQYNNATNISRSFLTNFDQYQAWDAIRQDEKWAYSHFRTGSGLDTVGKTIAKVTGISDAYGNFSIKVRYRLCYNETDLVLPLFPATLPHGNWVRFETCDYCRDKNRGDGGIYVTPRGFEVAKFYKGDSDLVITNGSFSNEAGAGSIYENQYDDNNTYFSTVVRSTLVQSTFKVKYTDSVSTDDNDTWIIVHLRGVIL